MKFEEVIAEDGGADAACSARERAEVELEVLQAKMTPLQNEINQLGRQFWVAKAQVAKQKYDLSASRYRERDYNEEYMESPAKTLSRLLDLEAVARRQIIELQSMMKR
jgi:hypothetical protein